MAESELRHRKPHDGEQQGKKSTTAKANSKTRNEDTSSVRLDILRVLTFLLFASCGLSYVISGGESFFWGMKNKPNYLKPEWWKSRLTGTLYITPQELSAYDGQDVNKPVYVAINGSIFDVSNGRHMYGPGGSYSFFAGRDASRAFVTGCFKEDLNEDLRGVYEMYLPLDDPEIDAQWTSAEIAKLKEEEVANAKERVYNGLKHWVDFFSNSKKYSFVGYVKREEGWLDKEPIKQLCPSALKNRKKRQPREE